MSVPAKLGPPMKTLSAKRSTNKHQHSRQRHRRRDASRGRAPVRGPGWRQGRGRDGQWVQRGELASSGSRRGPRLPRRPPLPSSQGGGGLPAPWENRSLLAYSPLRSADLYCIAEVPTSLLALSPPRVAQVPMRRRGSAGG